MPRDLGQPELVCLWYPPRCHDSPIPFCQGDKVDPARFGLIEDGVAFLRWHCR